MELTFIWKKYNAAFLCAGVFEPKVNYHNEGVMVVESQWLSLVYIRDLLRLCCCVSELTHMGVTFHKNRSPRYETSFILSLSFRLGGCTLNCDDRWGHSPRSKELSRRELIDIMIHRKYLEAFLGHCPLYNIHEHDNRINYFVKFPQLIFNFILRWVWQ